MQELVLSVGLVRTYFLQAMSAVWFIDTTGIGTEVPCTE
jgi:hypothetical protein